MRGLVLAFVAVLLPMLSIADVREDGRAFLAKNKLNEGVTELRSKLQYKVLKAGDGEYHPTVDSQCSVHYHGSLIDGEVFDSSVDRGRPTEFAPNRVIKGWTEALQLMVEGDKWELYIPSELAYGERGSGAKIKPGATLIFTVELLKILGKKVPADKCDPFTKEKCSEKELSYIATKESMGTEELEKEAERLESMLGKQMTEELSAWVSKRKTILKKLLSGAGKKKEEL